MLFGVLSANILHHKNIIVAEFAYKLALDQKYQFSQYVDTKEVRSNHPVHVS